MNYNESSDKIYNYLNKLLDEPAFVATLLLLSVIILILVIGAYILSSIGLQTIAKRQGREKTWLAWIPYARTYLYGKIAFDNDSTKSIILLILEILSLFVPLVSWVYLGFYCFAAYNLYRKLSDKEVAMTIFTALTLGFLDNLFLFAIRNNEFRDVSEQ